MDIDNGEKSEVGSAAVKPKDWTLFMLRISSLLATASATFVMALNKETKTIVVATIGSNPITAPLSARFQHNPAFVFFVIANGMASLHNLLTIVLDIFRHKFNNKGPCLVMIPILDMLNVASASAWDGVATFMAELGKNGNSYARWNKICDQFGSYCDRGGGDLIASFIGLGLLLVVTVFSIIKLVAPPTSVHRNYYNQAP